MDEDLKVAVQRFIISYLKLYADEVIFMLNVVDSNKPAFADPEGLKESLNNVSEELTRIGIAYFSEELEKSTDKANFVVTVE